MNYFCSGQEVENLYPEDAPMQTANLRFSKFYRLQHPDLPTYALFRYCIILLVYNLMRIEACQNVKTFKRHLQSINIDLQEDNAIKITILGEDVYCSKVRYRYVFVISKELYPLDGKLHYAITGFESSCKSISFENFLLPPDTIWRYIVEALDKENLKHIDLLKFLAVYEQVFRNDIALSTVQYAYKKLVSKSNIQSKDHNQHAGSLVRTWYWLNYCLFIVKKMHIETQINLRTELKSFHGMIKKASSTKAMDNLVEKIIHIQQSYYVGYCMLGDQKQGYWAVNPVYLKKKPNNLDIVRCQFVISGRTLKIPDDSMIDHQARQNLIVINFCNAVITLNIHPIIQQFLIEKMSQQSLLGHCFGVLLNLNHEDLCKGIFSQAKGMSAVAVDCVPDTFDKVFFIVTLQCHTFMETGADEPITEKDKAKPYVVVRSFISISVENNKKINISSPVFMLQVRQDMMNSFHHKRLSIFNRFAKNPSILATLKLSNLCERVNRKLCVMNKPENFNSTNTSSLAPLDLDNATKKQVFGKPNNTNQ